MTPPRLYRHLRQCRPSGSACRVCSAPSAAYASYSHDKSHEAGSTFADKTTSADDSSPASHKVNPRKEATTRWWTAIRNVLSHQAPSTTEAVHRSNASIEITETPRSSTSGTIVDSIAQRDTRKPTVEVEQPLGNSRDVEKHDQSTPTSSNLDASRNVSEELATSASVNANRDESMREQIRKLAEEVERLKAMIEPKSVPTVHHPVPNTISHSPEVISSESDQAEVRRADSSEPPAPPAEVLKQAWSRYRMSTYALVRTTRALVYMKHPSVAPISRAIHLRLREVARDATAEEDKQTWQILKQYTKLPKFQLLEAELPMPQEQLSWQAVISKKALRDDRNEQGQSVQRASPVHKEQTLTTAIQVQSKLMTSTAPFQITRTQSKDNATGSGDNGRIVESSHKKLESSHKDSAASDDEFNEQSLFEELFPLDPPSEPVRNYEQPPKLRIPDPLLRPELVDKPKTVKEQIVESFQNTGERITVLQLMHCSTSLTETDFRRLVPRGKHIDTWRRDGDFYKIIPGRDPLSMQRLPFYYLLFRNTHSALAYQNNVARLHKLSSLHQADSIMSAIPLPGNLIEDGEDIHVATTTYNLVPSNQKLDLFTVMEPFASGLRDLIERGGYHPIVPDTDKNGQRIWKVLMRIEGYEPLPSDLFNILRRDAFNQGTPLTIRNGSNTSIHRLRDLVDLRTKDKGSSPTNSTSTLDYMDPHVSALLAGSDEDISAKDVKQMIMNRIYNRWIIDFDSESAARRFALLWHRRVLPDIMADKGAWKDGEEARICNTEVLW